MAFAGAPFFLKKIFLFWRSSSSGAHILIFCWITLPETNSFAPKMDGCKIIPSLGPRAKSLMRAVKFHGVYFLKVKLTGHIRCIAYLPTFAWFLIYHTWMEWWYGYGILGPLWPVEYVVVLHEKRRESVKIVRPTPKQQTTLGSLHQTWWKNHQKMDGCKAETDLGRLGVPKRLLLPWGTFSQSKLVETS